MVGPDENQRDLTSQLSPSSFLSHNPWVVQTFWKFLLRKSLPPNSLASTRFAVFGLGDSSYAKFNFPAKKLHKRLLQLGAESIVERGDGDDQHPLGLDGALDPWMTKLWSSLDNFFPGAVNAPSDSNEPDPPSFRIRWLDDNNDTSKLASLPISQSNPPTVPATLSVNERITSASHFQDVRHFVLDLPASSPSPDSTLYSPGDVLNLRPRNLPDSVDAFLARFGWTDLGDRPFTLEGSQARPVPPALDRPLTLRTVLTSYLDAFGRPRRHFFGLLARFCSNEDHAERLREFASAEGQRDLYAYCHRPKRTAFEVLQDFNSAKFEPDYLFDFFPPMRPRAFSISSAPLVHPGQAHLTVAIVSYKTKLSIPRRGICTAYMKGLESGAPLDVWFTKGTLKLPRDGAPLVMIAPGTGLAPMLSLLEERIRRGEKDNTLFLGIRNTVGDFFYREQLEGYVEQGLLKLFVAASRDGPDKNKIYVQHRIREQGAWLWSKMSDPDSAILLSGSSGQMPQDVEKALLEVIAEQSGTDSEGAAAFLGKMEKEGRWRQECWS